MEVIVWTCAWLYPNIWAATWQNKQNECAPSEDSDQHGHPPSLIRVFAVRMKKPWVLNYPLSAQRRLWSDWADAQADLNLRWAHTHFVGFVMRRLKYSLARLHSENYSRFQRFQCLQIYSILPPKWHFSLDYFLDFFPVSRDISLILKMLIWRN